MHNMQTAISLSILIRVVIFDYTNLHHFIHQTGNEFFLSIGVRLRFMRLSPFLFPY